MVFCDFAIIYTFDKLKYINERVKYYAKMRQEDNMANGTKILDNGIIFHSFTMGELMISVLLLIIIIILLVNINKKD